MLVPLPALALLVLEDGRTFRGQTLGDRRDLRRAAFVTAMSGYQETLTDPSYHKQVVIATAPAASATPGGTARTTSPAGSGSPGTWYVTRLDPIQLAGQAQSSTPSSAPRGSSGCVRSIPALYPAPAERGAMRVGVSSLETSATALRERVQLKP